MRRKKYAKIYRGVIDARHGLDCHPRHLRSGTLKVAGLPDNADVDRFYSGLKVSVGGILFRRYVFFVVTWAGRSSITSVSCSVENKQCLVRLLDI